MGHRLQTLQSFVATIYTIGHSTRTLDELVAALQGHGIETLMDIRSFPMSRRLPHFNRESLETELPRCGIAYVWSKELGGRRKKMRDDSPNTGLRNESFRNYADYAATDAFRVGFTRLRDLAGSQRCAIMCSEAVWWRCHRRIISDYLIAQGIPVMHIMGPGKIDPATVTPNANQENNGTLVYRA